MDQIIPTRQGQIVKIINVMPGEDPDADYILADDPEPYDNKKLLMVYSVTEVQRATHQGRKPFGSQVQKGDLTVIANSLEEWVESWNDLYNDFPDNIGAHNNSPRPS